jgi:ubiquinone/menaquinone biosynthesis C-methylase UbiE
MIKDCEYRKIICDVMKYRKFESVLEFGCHNGTNLLNLQERYEVDIAGFDINLNFVNPELNIIEWDVNKLPYPYPDKSFDVVLIAGVLILFENVDKIISEAKRIAKKYIVLLEPHKKGETLKYCSQRYSHDFRKLLKNARMKKTYYPGSSYDYDASLIVYKI